MRRLIFFTRATIIAAILVVTVAVFLPQTLQYLSTPTGTTYTLGDGYMPDYYQYLSWIKSGSLGQILLSSRYSAIAQPNALVHPLFSLTGLIAGFFHLSTPIAYLVLRAGALLIFSFALYRFMPILFPSRQYRLIGLLFFLFGTGFYTLAPPGSQVPLIEPIPWSGHFSIISKYSLPPHHLLALAAWIGFLMLFTRPPRAGNLPFCVLLGWGLALLNPSLFLFALVFLACGVIVFLAKERLQAITSQAHRLTFWQRPLLKSQWEKTHVTNLLMFFLCVLPIIAYNTLVLRWVPPWSIMYDRMRYFNPTTTLFAYLLSLGPLLPLSLLGVWVLRKNLSILHTILISWAYLPILFFPLVGTILPINYSRLLQTYQYIPITFLAAASFSSFIRPGLARQGRALKNLKEFVGVLLIAAGILYGSVAYVATLKPKLQPHDLSFYNVFVPKPLLAAFGFLDKLPKEQVVLSGEYVSHMIPAFTRHRTLIGRDDSVADYYPLRDKVFAFLDGRMTEAEALQFVREQRVEYVVFGVDTKPLVDLPIKDYRFFSPVFSDGSVSVVEIDKNLP